MERVLHMDFCKPFSECKVSELAVYLADLLRDDGHSLPHIHQEVNTALINATITELVNRKRDDMVLSEINYAISRNIISGKPVFSPLKKRSFGQLFQGVDDVEVSIFLADEIRDACDNVACHSSLQWEMTALLVLVAIEELGKRKRRAICLLASVLNDLIIEGTLF